MRHDSEFAAYLAARWPTVVRTLVLLGLDQRAAEETALASFATSQSRWARVERADDVDVDVYRTVLDCWARRRRRWVEPAPGSGPAPDDRALLLAALETELDRLTPDLRSVLVLRFVAGLSEAQVAEVLDLTAGEVETAVSVALGRVDLTRLRETSP